MLEVTVFLDEEDMYQGKHMPEHIMRFLMHHGIMGASAFAATMGYGHKHHLQHPGMLGTVDEGPLMIMFVDEEAKVRAVLPHLKEIVGKGLIVIKKADRYTD
jgi:PII-like signaling protein